MTEPTTPAAAAPASERPMVVLVDEGTVTPPEALAAQLRRLAREARSNGLSPRRDLPTRPTSPES